MLAKYKKILIISIISIAVSLNVLTFAAAYPQTLSPPSSTLAHDFSAYYIGAWRLFHNPTTIYYSGSYPGDYQITPSPQTFKYTPSFLLWFSPFLTLSYQDALTVFDLLQVASIFALAFFVYKIVKDKNVFLGTAVAFLVLVEPSPGFLVSPSEVNFLGYHFTSLFPQILAPMYYAGYSLGNAHVIQVAFIVGALYFGFVKKPWFSAVFFALSVFDPRASLIALPLLLWYNRQRLWQFIVGSTVFLVVSNLPFFFYYDIGFTFIRNEVNGNIVSQIYGYDLLSIYAVVVLSIMEIVSILDSRRTLFSLRARRTKVTSCNEAEKVKKRIYRITF